MRLDSFVKYMRDALTRFQVEQERAGVTEDSFSMWWRRLHHHVRSERPKTIDPGLRVAQATNDVEEFKAALPTRPRGRKP